MKALNKTLVTLLLMAILGSGTAFSGTLQNGDVRQRGIEFDQFGRIIRDVYGPITYPEDGSLVQSTNEASPTMTAIVPEFQPGSGALPSLFSETWKTSIFGARIGKSGLITADIDNDGVLEIVCAGSWGYDFWYVLEYSSVSDSYEFQWISSLYDQGISRIAGFDTDGNGVIELFLGLGNGDILVYDGATLSQTASILSPAANVNRILFADGDNDGNKEIVFCDNSNLFFYDPSSLELKSQLAYGSSDFEIGNVDADDANEIVLANGLILQYDGETCTVEWDYPGGVFGYYVELSDIDSDGKLEIVGASAWYFITSFDADLQSPKWQIPIFDTGAFLMTDVDGDGKDELLLGDGQWGYIHCYNATTTAEEWSIHNPDCGVTNIGVADTDGDSILEILWGGGDHLYVHSIPTLALEWQSIYLEGPFHAIDVGDVDSDGCPELVFASFDREYGNSNGIVSIYDAATHRLEWQSSGNLFDGYVQTGIQALKIADVDDDGEQEVVVATDRSLDGAIYIIDGATHEIEHSYFYDEGTPIYSLAIADVDNDGQTEIVAGGGTITTGSPGVYVYVINGSTGSVEWHSISLGAYPSKIYAVEVADIDDDGVPEIVATDDSIFVIDGISHQQWQSYLGGCYGLALSDIDNDAIEDILVGTNSGDILALDGKTYTQKLNFNVSASSIVGLRACDVGQDGSADIVFASGGFLSVYNIPDSLLLWQSEKLASSVGDSNAIAIYQSGIFSRISVGTSYTVVEFGENCSSEPIVDIKANGSDSSITVKRRNILTVTCDLKAQCSSGDDSDLWLVAQTPKGLYHYDMGGTWKPGLAVTCQGPLPDWNQKEVLKKSGLPLGTSTIHFGVDMNMNGVVDYDCLYEDTVEVTVTR